MPTDMTRVWYKEAYGPGQDRGTAAVRDGCPVCCVYIVKSSGDGVVGINSAGPAGRWDQNRLISRTSRQSGPHRLGHPTCSVRLKTRTISRFGCVVGAGLLGVRHRPPRSFEPLSAGATLNLCCLEGCAGWVLGILFSNQPLIQEPGGLLKTGFDILCQSWETICINPHTVHTPGFPPCY